MGLERENSGAMWYLKDFSLFECLSEEQLMTISAMVRLDVVLRREFLSYDDREGDVLFLVKSGFLRVLRMLEDGREVTVDVIGPGTIFGRIGETSSAGSTPREIAEAIDEATVCVVMRQTFEKALKEWPELHRHVTMHLDGRAEILKERLVDLAFRSVPSRMASLFLRLGDTYGTRTLAGVRIEASISQQDIAYLIGATRQTVATELSRWRDTGIVVLQRKCYTLTNRSALEQIMAIR